MSEERLEEVRKALNDEFHKKCYYCEYSSNNCPSGMIKCKLTGEMLDINHSCKRWKLSEEFVKIIAFKTNLFEKKN